MPGAHPAEAAKFQLGYRPALDGLRAVAVLLVMLHHTAAYLWPSLRSTLATGGFLGVDIFFVLSGFLITIIVLAPGSGLASPTDSEPASADTRSISSRLLRFYSRRIRRLVPALVVLLVFLGGCTAVFHSPSPRVYAETVGWVLSYTGNWALSSRPFAQEVSHTWSLAIEGQFYLVWPLVTVVVLRLANGSRAALAAVAGAGIVAVVAWRAHAWHQQHNWLALYIRTPARFDALLVGCLAGLAVSSGWVTGRAVLLWQWALGVGLTVLVVLGFAVRGDTGALYDGGLTAISALAAVVVVGVMFVPPSDPLRRLLASAPLVVVGRWSYSLYLWHFPLFSLLGQHQPDWSPWVRTPVGWALAFGAAILSYRFVETPFLRHRVRPQPGASAARPAR